MLIVYMSALARQAIHCTNLEKECDSAHVPNGVISEAALSEKNEENAWFPVPKYFGLVDVFLYPANCSSPVCCLL